MIRSRALSVAIAAVAATSVVAPPLAAQQRALSIESLLSAPFPSNMSAAPVGGGVAWVQNDRGVRNVWVALPPGYQGRQNVVHRG